MAGRYKLNNDGSVYYDAQDTGPDQASPDQIQQYQQSQQAAAPPAPPSSSGSYMPPTGGITGGLPTGNGSGLQPAPPIDFSGVTMGGNPSGIRAWDPSLQPVPGFNYNADNQTQIKSPTDGITMPQTPIGDRWWNRGLPQSSWTEMPPNDFGIPPGSTVQQVGTSQVPTGGAVPNGFDATKWNDPTKHDPKYDAGHMLASGQSLEQIGRYIQQTYPGYKYLGGDKILGPDGATYDFSFGSGAGINAPQWTQVAGGADSGGAGGYGSTSGQIGTGSGSSYGVGGTGGAPTSSAFSDQVRQLLMQQIGGLSGPVTGNDPQIKAEMDAQDAALTRNQRDQRAAAAERMAMNGLLNGGQSSGAFDQELNSEFENKGQQLTQLQADLFTREISQRRQLVQSYLNMALQSGDAESARQLQAYLAQLDNAYRYAALAQNQGQFNDTFGLNAAQFQYQKNRDLAQYGGGY